MGKGNPVQFIYNWYCFFTIMTNNISKPPVQNSEPVKSYAPGTIERKTIQLEYAKTIKKIINI